jgi:hypothetical protein
MGIKSLIGFENKLFIKSFFFNSCLVTRYKYDRLPLWVKSKRYTLHSIISFKAKFFHVGMTRTIKRIGMRSLEARPISFQQSGIG